MTGSLLLIFLGLFIWGLKNGQFKNIEEAKYTMLEDKGTDKKTRRKGDKA
jgi:cbb3-type cytochrome oxidase maturation protein